MSDQTILVSMAGVAAMTFLGDWTDIHPQAAKPRVLIGAAVATVGLLIIGNWLPKLASVLATTALLTAALTVGAPVFVRVKEAITT